jgi:hypothetical protein
VQLLWKTAKSEAWPDRTWSSINSLHFKFAANGYVGVIAQEVICDHRGNLMPPLHGMLILCVLLAVAVLLARLNSGRKNRRSPL